jgi:hypothetical protein
MRRLVRLLSVAFLSASACALQTATAAQTPPQTARQALMEMFFGKTQGTLVKHLPAATRETLDKSGALASMQQYSSMLTPQASGPNAGVGLGRCYCRRMIPRRVTEVTVENDALHTDEIEVTFHTSKNGQAAGPFRHDHVHDETGGTDLT